MVDADPPFVDTHVHFWDLATDGLRWPWLEAGYRSGVQLRDLDAVQELGASSYTVPELRADAAGAGLAGCVNVQGATGDDPARETSWLDSVADEHGWPLAQVATVALTAVGAPALLRRVAASPRLRGVRDLTATKTFDADALAPAMAALAEHGLSVELRLPLERLGELAAFAARWPSVPLVLGHGALPRTRTAADLAGWREAVGPLGELPGVSCKLATLVAGDGPGWTVDDIRPWLLAAVDRFGAERVMLGTNWPLDRGLGRYDELVGAFRQVAADLPLDDRHALLHGTAERVYRLPPVAGGD